MDKITLLIVGEDSSSRRGLTAIFASESAFNVLGSFSLGEVKDQAAVLQPDTIIVDLEDDVLKYKHEVKQLKKECPFSLILALVGKELNNDLVDVLLQGVDGCMPKGIIRGCMVKAVELACRAGIFCLPGSFIKMISCPEPVKANINSKFKNTDGINGFLTKREIEILQLMAKNYSNREIADKLYISEPTVKTHVSNILRKLGQDNRAQAIVFSYKNGLIEESYCSAKIKSQ